jgi:WD40 repeat protein
LDVETGNVIRDLPGTPAQMWSLRVSPDGRQALSLTADRTAHLWDLESGKELRRWDGKTTLPNQFTEDSKQLVLLDATDPDRPFRLWNIAESKESPGNGMPIRGVFPDSFLKGGKEMVVCREGALHFHDRASGKALRRIELVRGLEGQQGREGSISPDGRLFLTPATDGTLRLWDLTADRELHRYPELGQKPHGGTPMFSPDGQYAAIGRPGCVVVLRLPAVPMKP